MAEGWDIETRALQHSSHDTISERWGERTHSKTQAQCACTPPLSPLPGSFSPPLGRELGTRLDEFDISYLQLQPRQRKYKSRYGMQLWLGIPS